MQPAQSPHPQTAALDALGNAVRRDIVQQLAIKPTTAGALADRMPISRPAVSKHLRVLQDAGLISHVPQGTRNVYQLEKKGFDAARGWLDSFWSDALTRFRMVAENTDPEARDE